MEPRSRDEETLPPRALSLLHEVSTPIHALRDLDEMLVRIVQDIARPLDAEGASLAMHDTDRSEFSPG